MAQRHDQRWIVKDYLPRDIASPALGGNSAPINSVHDNGLWPKRREL
jgi:hypothetical protein